MKTIDYTIVDIHNCTIIEQATNGYMVTTFDETMDDNEEIILNRELFETNDNLNEPDWIKLKEMLWYILDALGEYGSKHHSKTLEIKIKHNAEFP